MFRAYGLTDKGRVRPTNQDCFAVEEDLGLCVIADGMGGHNAGEVAAQVAVTAVVEAVRAARRPTTSACDPALDLDTWPFGYDPSLSDDGNLLRTAVHIASVQVVEAAFSAQHYAGMGTTIVAARVVEGRLAVAHAGDSRLYLLAGGHLHQVTRDDSWVAAMFGDDPAATPAVLRHHPMRNMLTNALGGRQRTRVHVVERPLTGGEVLLLSTDGVHSVLDDDRLQRLLVEYEEPRRAAEKMISAALASGSRDNCTAIVARYC